MCGWGLTFCYEPLRKIKGSWGFLLWKSDVTPTILKLCTFRWCVSFFSLDIIQKICVRKDLGWNNSDEHFMYDQFRSWASEILFYLKDTVQAYFCYRHTLLQTTFWVGYFICVKITPFNGCSLIWLNLIK